MPHTITFAVLSPTYGMHLYTADLARTVSVGASGAGRLDSGRDVACNVSTTNGRHSDPPVRVVTTTTAPRDVYDPGIDLVAPITTHGTGFSREGLDLRSYRNLQSSIFNLQSSDQWGPTFLLPSSIFHFTGVHAWNVPLVYALRRRGVHVIHTLHDLAAHSGVRHAGLIGLWNRLIIASGATILVHGRCWRDELIRRGVPASRVVYTPLLHGFWSAATDPDQPSTRPTSSFFHLQSSIPPSPEQSSIFNLQSSIVALFFGRIEPYKGAEVLVEAWRQLQVEGQQVEGCTLVLAGKVADGVRLGELPPGVEVWDRRIGDEEGIDLFRRAAVLVLPYRDATQSALVAAAARFGVPAIVTRTGALPEYVVDGETGWIVPPGDAGALAAALAEALSSPELLVQIGAAARSWYDDARLEEQRTLTELYGD